MGEQGEPCSLDNIVRQIGLAGEFKRCRHGVGSFSSEGISVRKTTLGGVGQPVQGLWFPWDIKKAPIPGLGVGAF